MWATRARALVLLALLLVAAPAESAGLRLRQQSGSNGSLSQEAAGEVALPKFLTPFVNIAKVSHQLGKMQMPVVKQQVRDYFNKFDSVPNPRGSDMPVLDDIDMDAPEISMARAFNQMRDDPNFGKARDDFVDKFADFAKGAKDGTGHGVLSHVFGSALKSIEKHENNRDAWEKINEEAAQIAQNELTSLFNLVGISGKPSRFTASLYHYATVQGMMKEQDVSWPDEPMTVSKLYNDVVEDQLKNPLKELAETTGRELVQGKSLSEMTIKQKTSEHLATSVVVLDDFIHSFATQDDAKKTPNTFPLTSWYFRGIGSSLRPDVKNLDLPTDLKEKVADLIRAL